MKASKAVKPIRLEVGTTEIVVATADPRRATAMTLAIGRATRAAAREAVAAAKVPLRVLRLRARKTATRLGAELEGAIVVVAVTQQNARHLPELVDTLRGSRVAGVQMVWDGANPVRARVERHVFDVLEHARSTRGGPPVVLSREREPAAVLRMLIATQQQQRKYESRS